MKDLSGRISDHLSPLLTLVTSRKVHDREEIVDLVLEAISKADLMVVEKDKFQSVMKMFHRLQESLDSQQKQLSYLRQYNIRGD